MSEVFTLRSPSLGDSSLALQDSSSSQSVGSSPFVPVVTSSKVSHKQIITCLEKDLSEREVSVGSAGQEQSILAKLKKQVKGMEAYEAKDEVLPLSLENLNDKELKVLFNWMERLAPESNERLSLIRAFTQPNSEGAIPIHRIFFFVWPSFFKRLRTFPEGSLPPIEWVEGICRPDKKGMTPFHRIASKAHVKSSSGLFQNEATFEKIVKEIKSFATGSSQQQELFLIFVKVFQYQDKYGDNPLHYLMKMADREGNQEFLCFLLHEIEALFQGNEKQKQGAKMFVDAFCQKRSTEEYKVEPRSSLDFLFVHEGGLNTFLKWLQKHPGSFLMLDLKEREGVAGSLCYLSTELSFGRFSLLMSGLFQVSKTDSSFQKYSRDFLVKINDLLQGNEGEKRKGKVLFRSFLNILCISRGRFEGWLAFIAKDENILPAFFQAILFFLEEPSCRNFFEEKVKNLNEHLFHLILFCIKYYPFLNESFALLFERLSGTNESRSSLSPSAIIVNVLNRIDHLLQGSEEEKRRGEALFIDFLNFVQTSDKYFKEIILGFAGARAFPLFVKVMKILLKESEPIKSLFEEKIQPFYSSEIFGKEVSDLDVDLFFNYLVVFLLNEKGEEEKQEAIPPQLAEAFNSFIFNRSRRLTELLEGGVSPFQARFFVYLFNRSSLLSNYSSWERVNQLLKRSLRPERIQALREAWPSLPEGPQGSSPIASIIDEFTPEFLNELEEVEEGF